MKKILFSLFAKIVAVMATSCSDDQYEAPAIPIEFKVSHTNVGFLKDAASRQLFVECNTAPTVSADQTWIHLGTPAYNLDSRRVYAFEISVDENTGYDARTGVVTVNADGQTATINVTQLSNDGIILESSTIDGDIDAAGGSFAAKILATGSYTTEISADWISPINSRAMSEYTESFTVNANLTPEVRTATVTFTLDANPELSVSVAVNQLGQVQTTGKTAKQVAKEIYLGWNLGNSMEAEGGETAWGNPTVTKQLIDGVKAQGINAVRIPCAWNQHLVDIDNPNAGFDPAWVSRVKEVVGYVLDNDMYAIINIHHDQGWLEEHPFEADKDAVNARQRVLWTMIANEFKAYGDKLMFAGVNEVHKPDWSNPTDANIKVQESYLQTFIDAVRATGGNNATRNLIVPTYACNPWFGLQMMTVPTDNVADHLFVEVHFYDPMTMTHDGTETLWGHRKGYTESTTQQEDYIDDLFGQLKSHFVDNGYPVILGEYGTKNNSSETHVLESESYYVEYVTSAAKKAGMVPFYWDNGTPQLGSFGIFNRNSGAVGASHLMDGLKRGATTEYPF